MCPCTLSPSESAERSAGSQLETLSLRPPRGRGLSLSLDGRHHRLLGNSPRAPVLQRGNEARVRDFRPFRHSCGDCSSDTLENEKGQGPPTEFSVVLFHICLGTGRSSRHAADSGNGVDIFKKNETV